MTLNMLQAKEFIEAYEIIKNKPLPISVSYKFAKIQNFIKNDVDFFLNKFQEIIRDYAATDEQGNYIQAQADGFLKVKEGLEEECSTKISELQDLTIDIDIEPFNIDDLGNIEIDPDTMRKLLPFIE